MPEPLINDVDEVLTTTRSVRRRLDFERPVSRELILECLDLALQAPAASNQEDWRFLVVLEPSLRAQIAGIVREVWEASVARPLAAGDATVSGRLDPTLRGGGEASARQQRVLDSARYLAMNLERVPTLVIAATAARRPRSPVGPTASGFYGSVYPALWSFQLALRSRGLGSCLLVAYLREAEAVARLLDIPPELTQVAMLAVGHTRSLAFRRAPRRPAAEVTRFNRWTA